MNPLYLVIYVAGAIGGTIGLLDPLTVSECQRQADEMHAELDPRIVTPDGYTAKDIEFKRERHAVRPRHYEEK